MLFIEIWPSEGRQSRATNRSQIREPGSCEHLILARTQFSQVFTRFEEDSPIMLYTVICAVLLLYSPLYRESGHGLRSNTLSF